MRLWVDLVSHLQVLWGVHLARALRVWILTLTPVPVVILVETLPVGSMVDQPLLHVLINEAIMCNPVHAEFARLIQQIVLHDLTNHVGLLCR